MIFMILVANNQGGDFVLEDYRPPTFQFWGRGVWGRGTWGMNDEFVPGSTPPPAGNTPTKKKFWFFFRRRR